MNHFHRVIFNRSLGVRQVVSEIASSGRGAGSEGNASSAGTGLCQMPRLSTLAAACLLPFWALPHAQAAICNAATSAELVTCISGATAGDTVNLVANIVLSANLGPITKNLSINGNGNTLDGADTYRGFFVQQGTVNINDLTITRATAQGGAGGANGGGGMGAGGGLFVNSGAAVTISNVRFDSNRAIGGSGTNSRNSGGGGGMEGAGGNPFPVSQASGGLGGGGGFGGTNPFPPSAGGALIGSGGAAGAASTNFGNGGDGGIAFSGGGGGINDSRGGAGGDFAGGGGGGSNCGLGGKGGFGGGGGGGGCGGISARAGGTGGFGGGGGGNGGAAGFGGGDGGAAGSGVGGGGAGAGFGGAVFVRNGGNLTIAGNSNFQGNSVAGGTGAGSTSGGGTGGNGSSGGTDLFLQGNGNLGFDPAAGVTTVLHTDTIADQSSLGGTGANAGVWGLVKTGDGTLRLTGVAGFSGSVQINQGTVTAVNDGNLGLGSQLGLSGGTLQYLAGFNSTRSITLGAGGGTFDTQGFSSALQGAIAGAGSLTKTGTGALELQGANAYTGATTINGGTLALSGVGSIASSSGLINNGTFDISGASSDATVTALTGSGAVYLASRTLTVSNASGSFAGAIDGTGGLTLAGGSQTLSGTNTYIGDTTITGGTLQLGSGGTTGSITGNVLDNGTLAFDRSDNLTFLGVISGSGNVRQAGTGILTLSGANTYSGGTHFDAGTLTVSADNNLGDAVGGLTFNGGTLQNTAAFTTTRAVSLNAGGGSLQTDADLSLAGTIGGAGSLTKTGAGKLELLGNNNYSGSTTLSAGTTQVGDGGTTGSLGSGTITNNAVLAFNRSDAITVTSAITGTGTLEQQGSNSLILTADNSYSGGTTISNGTLQLGNGGATGSITGNVTNNGTLAFNRSSALNFSGAISGGGNVQKLGTGTVTLSGVNTYTGNTTVMAGTLALATTGAAGSGDILVENATNQNSTLQVDTGVTINNQVAANNGATVNNSGAIVRTTAGSLGVISFGGATINNSATGSIKGNDFGLLFASQGGTVTNSGGVIESTGSGASGFGIAMQGSPGMVINEAGGTIKSGGDGVYLLGGGSVVNDVNSTIIAGAGKSSAIINGGTLVNKGSLIGQVFLDPSNTGTAVNTVTLFTGSSLQGDLQIGTNAASSLILDGSGPQRLSDAVTNGIQFAGNLVQQGGGTWTVDKDLTAASTTIAAGSTMQLGNGATVGSVTGPITNNGTLAVNRADTLALNSTISGAGGLTQTGSGATLLTADNTYSGSTTISAGTLQVGNGGTTGTLGTGAVTNNAALVFNRSDAITVASDIGGTGTFDKQGAGILVLAGANTYSGGTTVSAGTLQVGNGGTTGTLGTGSVTNNATLMFNRSDDITAANDIGGTGSLTKTGAGTLVLTGTNTYSGATTVSAGILQIGNGGTAGSLGTGAVTNNAALVFNRSDAITVANAIGGTGTFDKQGASTLILAGANTYNGATTVSAGTLQVGNGGTAGSLGTGAVTNNAALVFNRSDVVTATNAINGSGTLDKQGAGTLILAGTNTNTYSGATTVTAGTLQIGNGGTAGSLGTGAIANNAALAFNRSDAVTVANPISGAGTLSQNGAGNLILTGANTYAGATTVSAGRLSVNGSITSATTVNSGGTVGGNGTVGNVNVASGGVLAPGNSIGTLTVNGNLTFAPGSVYRVETDAAGNADRVNVVGAPGSLTINGGTVDVQAGAGNYARNTRYTILTSTGATTGAFTGVTSNLAFLTPTLSYLPNGVTLNLLAENAPVYNTVAQTPNQTSIANYLNSFANTPGNAEAAALIRQIDNLSADQVRVAFDSMSGSPHAAASQTASALGRSFSATLTARTGATASTGLSNSGSSTAGLKAIKLASVNPALLTRPGDVVSDSPLRVAAAEQAGAGQSGSALQSTGGLWGQAMGTGGRTGSDGTGPASRYRANGFVFGYDQPITSNWLAGAALAYNKAQWEASTRGIAPASGSISSPQAGLYARYAAGPLQVRLDGTYSDHRFSTDRTVTIGNASSVARSSHGGTEWAFAAQAEYSLPSGDWDIRPLAGLRHARLAEDGFTETGAGAASLTVDARRSQNTVASLGVKFIRPLSPGNTDKGALELRAVASHLMGDNDSPITSRLAGQAGSFTAAGTPLKRTALTLGGTLTGQLSRGLNAYADAAYEYRGAGQNAFMFTAGLRMSW